MEIAPTVHLFWLAQLGACAIMTGVIWVVQLILYPSFAQIESSRFVSFHARHSFMITIIVGPTMIVELLTAAYLWYASTAKALTAINLASVLGIWLCTAFLSVPLHKKLEKRWDLLDAHRLVVTNWPRTLLWTLRFFFLFIVMAVNGF